jgi:hypothetical protein
MLFSMDVPAVLILIDRSRGSTRVDVRRTVTPLEVGGADVAAEVSFRVMFRSRPARLSA